MKESIPELETLNGQGVQEAITHSYRLTTKQRLIFLSPEHAS
jgi:hypothetical protein